MSDALAISYLRSQGLLGETAAIDFLMGHGWRNDTLFHATSRDEFRLRAEFIARFGFAILDAATIAYLAKFSPLIEVGAGCGYWAYELRRAAADVVATDPGTGRYRDLDEGWTKPYVEIERLDGKAAVDKYRGRALLMVWPDLNDPWSVETVATYAGNTVLLIGEGRDGCTGTPELFDRLETDFVPRDEVAIPTFWWVHDSLTVWERRP